MFQQNSLNYSEYCTRKCGCWEKYCISKIANKILETVLSPWLFAKNEKDALAVWLNGWYAGRVSSFYPGNSYSSSEMREVDRGWGGSECVEWFIEDQALNHPLPPPPVSKLSLFLSLPICRRSSLLTGEGGGGGGAGVKSYDRWESLVFYK